jgi:hypothetical protein
LRKRWLGHAAAVFDQLFHPDNQEQLRSFDQREKFALDMGRELMAWVLQQHVNADPAARPPENEPNCCPKCGKPGQRLTAPAEPLPFRRLTTGTGEVELKREKWRCTTCRVVFFPPGR